MLVILSTQADWRTQAYWRTQAHWKTQAHWGTAEALGGRSRRRVSVEGSDPVATIGHQASAPKGSS